MNIYKCDVCKTVYEVIDPVDAQREIVCCGKPARLLKAGETDAATEKHVPVVSVEGDKLIINVGSVDHPMTPEHWITSIWAEFADGSIERSGLTPNNKPHTEFDLKGRTGEVTIYEYCNLHGLWKTTITIE
ncbi:desulfoferrodoxin family protein [Faecalitalea cylindroides]|uniref:Desulfoferrodoxin n=1 Tax=Faecalitalea cylindroides T2-87 TaxID=717960 RepID=D4JFW6_9FIRM|nr:desulfoferrodoxin family protein [Faecalitalea cylindroides]OUN63654.1 desulfoferrodoxin [Faecalitalea cylindroides]CBK89088.1 Desulfoferrodoxin [Faecalitalea cylindroides T2-87]